MKKKMGYVSIPFKLDMKNFINSDNINIQKNTQYKLNSIVVHVGQGINHGHYYSIIKQMNEWFIIDDELMKV